MMQRFYIFSLVFCEGVFRNLSGMNRKTNDAEDCPQNGRRQRGSKSFDQIPHICGQRPGDFHERIHRRRFLSTFNTADEDGRKVCFFSQLFLGEIGAFTFGANGFTQKTAVWLVGRHDGLKDGKRGKSTMSLTTILSLPSLSCGCKPHESYRKLKQ